MLRGGMSRHLWLGGDGATSPMEKRACKRSLNCYGKYNVNVINENSTKVTRQYDPRGIRKRSSNSPHIQG
jgi:hypothetical protein